MKIIKIKLQILLTALIICQIFALMNKQDMPIEAEAIPTLIPLALQKQNSFAKPAYASTDIGGEVISIPRKPYSENNNTTLQAQAENEAAKIIQNGDISGLHSTLQENAPALKSMGY
jgi:hypothetical protein